MSRINKDIYPYVDLIREHIKASQEGIGNFSLARMIFPVIEAVARPLGKTPQQLMHELRVPYPYLCWSMYRDGFTHNDEFISAEYSEGPDIHSAYPSIVLGVEGHIITHSVHGNQVVISLMKLLEDLRSYVERNIPETDRQITITQKIEYFMPNASGTLSENEEEVKNIIGEIKELG